MRVILEMEGVGFIGASKLNYIVFEKFQEGKDKQGNPTKHPASPKFFMSLSSALDEFRCFFLGKKLVSARNACKSLDELLARVEKINKEWSEFYGKYRLKTEKELKEGVGGGD
jgi:hypothetical protein